MAESTSLSDTLIFRRLISASASFSRMSCCSTSRSGIASGVIRGLAFIIFSMVWIRLRMSLCRMISPLTLATILSTVSPTATPEPRNKAMHTKIIPLTFMGFPQRQM